MTAEAPGSRRPRWLRTHGILVLAVVWLVAAPALARDLTAEERAALQETADRFKAATKQGNGAELAAVLPPRMLRWIAKENGENPDGLRRSIAEQIDRLKEAGIRMSVSLDLGHAAFESLNDGTPYVAIPTHEVVDRPKQMDIEIETLALMEDGKWYLLDVSNETRLERLRHAFPEFAGIVLPTPAAGAVK